STPGLGLLLWIKTVYGNKAKEAWEKLAPRILTVTKGWSEAYGLFLKGEAPMVLSYTTSPAYHVIAENDHRYQAAAFSDGHYQQIEVSAMLKSSKNPQLARAFLNFTQQKTFQEIIPTTNWMLPAALPKNAWPAGFDQLVVADPVLLMADEDVARQRKNWINEWLRALVK
ncbi:MAG: thiamine ABC transporter substrate-binding protein, partial [Moraxella osloensis]|nr:thiamine ABC transporter substrate-binding protein [Moraxella osloensis]